MVNVSKIITTVLVFLFGIAILFLTVTIAIDFLFNFPPCGPDEVKVIKGVTYYRCCESDYTIEGNEFVKTGEICEIIKYEPGIYKVLGVDG